MGAETWVMQLQEAVTGDQGSRPKNPWNQQKLQEAGGILPTPHPQSL